MAASGRGDVIGRQSLEPGRRAQEPNGVNFIKEAKMLLTVESGKVKEPFYIITL